MTLKPRLVRVVTNSDAYLWHISNTVNMLSENYEIFILGSGVSKYRDIYKNVTFIDIAIKRKPSPIVDLYTLMTLIYHFLKIKPVIVHSIMPKAGLLSSLAAFITRIPIRMHTFTGQVWYNKSGLSRLFLKLLDKLVNSLNTVCLTDSFSQSNFLYDEGIRYRKQVIPTLNKGSICGVDIRKINSSTEQMNENASLLKMKHNVKDSDFIFTYIARKTKDKGAIDIIKAFENVCAMNPSKPIKLFFIGPYEEEIKNEISISLKQKNIVDIGKVDNKFDYLYLTDVLCLPSYREGFGNIVIDAAALRVPAVGYDVVGLIDSIKNNETGLVSRKGDVKAFSENMSKLLNDEVLVKKLGGNAHKNVESNFDTKIMSEAYHKFYSHLISSSIQS